MLEIEALYEVDPLCRGEHADLLVDLKKLGEPAGMVGLEVIEDEIVDIFEGHTYGSELILELDRGPDPVPHQIDESHLLSPDEV